MARREGMIEVAHEGRLFRTLLFAERHVGVEIPDVPAVGDRHVAGVSFAVDHRETIFAVEPVRVHVVDEARDEEILFVPFGKIGCERCRVVELGEPDAGMRAARPRDHRKAQLTRDVLAGDLSLGEIRQLRARRMDGRGNVETRNAREQPMQFVAIEIAYAIGAIEQRARPVRRRLLDQGECIAAFLGIGSNHDGNVVLGQALGQADALDHVERQQFDVGAFEQKIDRRVAAHVDVGGKREHAQARLRSDARRAE